MAIRFGVLTLALSFLAPGVLCGTNHDGARPAHSKRDLDFGEGQLPFVNNNYTLFKSGGSLKPRQVQGCTQDPTSILCSNSTVCCSQEYPVCCVAQNWCCGEGGNCCPGQQNCCDDGYHCCPKETCCADDENCLYKGWCCPKDKETCGRADFCLADDQICCDGSPDGFCDSGLECLKTSNGSAACCSSGKKPCNGGYCCDEGFTCAGGGICLPPSSSTTSTTQAPQTSTTGSAAPASSTPGDAGLKMMESSLSPLFGLLLLLIPVGLLL